MRPPCVAAGRLLWLFIGLALPLSKAQNPVDFDSCHSSLLLADVNTDGRVTAEEFPTFVLLFGDGCEMEDATRNAIFQSLACLCERFQGADSGCCDGDNAHLSTRALTEENATPIEDLQLRTVCQVSDQSIRAACPSGGPNFSNLDPDPEVTPSPTNSPTPSPTVLATNPKEKLLEDESSSSRGLSDGGIAGILIACFVVLLLIVWCLLCGKASRQNQSKSRKRRAAVYQDEDEESEEASITSLSASLRSTQKKLPYASLRTGESLSPEDAFQAFASHDSQQLSFPTKDDGPMEDAFAVLESGSSFEDDSENGDRRRVPLRRPTNESIEIFTDESTDSSGSGSNVVIAGGGEEGQFGSSGEEEEAMILQTASSDPLVDVGVPREPEDVIELEGDGSWNEPDPEQAQAAFPDDPFSDFTAGQAASQDPSQLGQGPAAPENIESNQQGSAASDEQDGRLEENTPVSLGFAMTDPQTKEEDPFRAKTPPTMNSERSWDELRASLTSRETTGETEGQTAASDGISKGAELSDDALVVHGHPPAPGSAQIGMDPNEKQARSEQVDRSSRHRKANAPLPENPNPNKSIEVGSQEQSNARRASGSERNMSRRLQETQAATFVDKSTARERRASSSQLERGQRRGINEAPPRRVSRQTMGPSARGDRRRSRPNPRRRHTNPVHHEMSPSQAQGIAVERRSTVPGPDPIRTRRPAGERPARAVGSEVDAATKRPPSLEPRAKDASAAADRSSLREQSRQAKNTPGENQRPSNPDTRAGSELGRGTERRLDERDRGKRRAETSRVPSKTESKSPSDHSPPAEGETRKRYDGPASASKRKPPNPETERQKARSLQRSAGNGIHHYDHGQRRERKQAPIARGERRGQESSVAKNAEVRSLKPEKEPSLTDDLKIYGRDEKRESRRNQAAPDAGVLRNVQSSLPNSETESHARRRPPFRVAPTSERGKMTHAPVKIESSEGRPRKEESSKPSDLSSDRREERGEETENAQQRRTG